MLVNNGGALDDLSLCHLDDSSLVNLTNARERAGWPCWTPDGRIVLSAVENGVFRLFVLDPRSGARERLTDTASSDDCRPNVSRDGRFVVFNREHMSWAGKTKAILIVGL